MKYPMSKMNDYYMKDLMPNIFKYLSNIELYWCLKICKYWRSITIDFLSKRKTIINCGPHLCQDLLLSPYIEKYVGSLGKFFPLQDKSLVRSRMGKIITASPMVNIKGIPRIDFIQYGPDDVIIRRQLCSNSLDILPHLEYLDIEVDHRLFYHSVGLFDLDLLIGLIKSIFDLSSRLRYVRIISHYEENYYWYLEYKKDISLETNIHFSALKCNAKLNTIFEYKVGIFRDFSDDAQQLGIFWSNIPIDVYPDLDIATDKKFNVMLFMGGWKIYKIFIPEDYLVVDTDGNPLNVGLNRLCEYGELVCLNHMICKILEIIHI